MAENQGPANGEPTLAAKIAPSVTKIDRMEWPLNSGDGVVLQAAETNSELQGPLKNAIMYSGIKDVQRLLQNGAPLIAEYVLESEGKPIGTTLDLVMLHKRFKLVLQLLRPPQTSPELSPEGATNEAILVEAGVEDANAAVSDEAKPDGEVPVEDEIPAPAEEPPAAPTNTQGSELAKAAKFAVAWSARDGRTDILEALLELGAAPTQCDERGRPALLLAAMRGQRRSLELLIAAGAWEQQNGSVAAAEAAAAAAPSDATAARAAAEAKAAKQELLKWMMHFKIPLPATEEQDASYEPPSALALRLGIIQQSGTTPEAAEAMEEARWTNTPHGRLAWPLRPPEEKGLPEGQGPLELAITGYGVKEVERIIALGAPLTAEYRLDAQGSDVGTALDLAILSQRYTLAMQLLRGSEGSVLATLSTRAVAWTARDGKIGLLQELLLLGGPPEQCDELGRSALLLATCRGRTECVAALLEAGAWPLEASRDKVLEWAAHYKMTCFSTCD